MKKTIAPLIAIAALALAGPASAGKAVPYTGKTSSGDKITFKVKNGRIHDLTAGIKMSCIPISGGWLNFGGSEVFGFTGSRPLKAHQKYSFMGPAAFHHSEVTLNNELWTKRRGDKITGRMRLQYQFLISKYPIGTFSNYSCLGGATFKASPKG